MIIEMIDDCDDEYDYDCDYNKEEMMMMI